MAEAIDDVLLVAAIDFGTTYSGYAFSFKHEFEIDPMKIQTNQTWSSGSKALFSHKAPTCILATPDKKFHSFGYEAEDKYSDLALDEEHEKWYFFRTFKMKLHNNMHLNRGMNIQDVYGKELPAKTVFSMGITYLSNHMLETLDKNGLLKDDERSKIQWVLTVPAIWNDKAKQFMREAAKEAGIDGNYLRIALEPEAASLYCRLLPLEKFVCSNTTSREMKPFQPGTKFMILDLGGGTVDVTIQRVSDEESLEEIHKATGNASGGTCVDEAFKNLLIRLVGNQVMMRFKSEYASDDLDLMREFETKKRSVTSDSDGKLCLRIPVSLGLSFQEDTGENLKDVIGQSNYAGKITIHQDKFQMNYGVVHSLFRDSIKSIVEHVGDLVKLDVCKDLKYVLMVGGFSECPLIQEAIRKGFPNLRVIVPHQAGLAVLMGAVLFGHNPRIVASRMAKFTYGIKTFTNFVNGVDPIEKKTLIDGKMKCRDRFSKHVEIGETIQIDKCLDPVNYKPLREESEAISLPIYVSTEPNPRYTTDDSCLLLGKVVVNLDPSSSKTIDRSVDVSMKFGGTELFVQATNRSSGKSTVAYFDFLEQGVTTD